MSLTASIAAEAAVEQDAADIYIFPASPAQQRLWLAADADPTRAAYNVPQALDIEGAIDIDALASAVDAVVDRHEALRTTFRRGDNGLAQVVRARRRIASDITDLKEDAAEAEIRAAVALEAARPFDLERGPLLRVRLIRAGGRRTILCLTLHHLICDGWSLDILSRDLARAYAAAAAGLRPDLGPAPLQYAEFVVWQQEGLEAEQARVAEFWRQELADLPPALSWPADFVRPAVPTGRGGRIVRALPEPAVHAVQRLAREEQTTPFVVMLAMFAAFLGRWTGDRDVAIGTPASGRDRVDLEDGRRPVHQHRRAAVPADARDVVPRARGRGRELMLQALRHQAMPIERVARRSPSRVCPA